METHRLPGTAVPASTRVTAHIVALPAFVTGIVMTGFLLWYLRDILVPLFVAFFLSYLVRPIADAMTKPFLWLSQISCCRRCCASLNRAVLRRQAGAAKGKGDDDGLLPLGTDGAPSADSDTGDSSDELQPCIGARRRRRRRRGAPRRPDAADASDGDGEGDSADSSSGPGPRAAALPKFFTGKSRWERWLGITMAAVLVLAFILLLCILVAGAVDTFQTKYFSRFQQRALQLTEGVVKHLNKFFHVNGNSIIKAVENAESTLPMEFLKGVVVTAWGIVASLAMILLFLVYFLLETPPRRTASSVRAQIDSDITKYIQAKTIVSFTVGFLVWLVLGPLLNVKLAFVLGVLTFLLHYIPTVGALVASLLSLPIVVLDPDLSTSAMVLGILLPQIIFAIVGNVVEPMLFGRLIILHPIIVLLAVGFWYILWGVPGAIISVPITAVLRQTFKRGSADQPHPYAVAINRVMMGDVEWLYGSDDHHTGGGKDTAAPAAEPQPEEDSPAELV